MPPRIPEDEAQAIADLYAEGYTIKQIAEAAGRSYNGVLNLLTRRGARTRDSTGYVTDSRKSGPKIMPAGPVFAGLPEADIKRIERWLQRFDFLSWLMTHDGEGILVGARVSSGVPLEGVANVRAFTIRASATWSEMDEDQWTHRSHCRVSFDGGETWAEFTPREKTAAERQHDWGRTPWRKLVRSDLRNAGLEV